MKKIIILSFLLINITSGSGMENEKRDDGPNKLTAFIRAEVNRISENFLRNMNQYFERTGNPKRIPEMLINMPDRKELDQPRESKKRPGKTEDSTTPVTAESSTEPLVSNDLSFEQITVNFEEYQQTPAPALKSKIVAALEQQMKLEKLSYPETEKAIKIAESLENQKLKESLDFYRQKIWFDKIKRDFEEYENNNKPSQLKHTIVMNLNNLILSQVLQGSEKGEAIKIAEGIEAGNLEVRLGAYQQTRTTNYGFSDLSRELYHIIVNEVLNSGGIKEIYNLLIVSKGLNMDLLSFPIQLNFERVEERINDKTLAKIVQLFPKMRTLDMRGCFNITDAGLKYLEGLTNLFYLRLECNNNTDNQITDDGLKPLENLKKLNHLCLITPCITNQGLQPLLESLEKLTYLSLTMRNFSTDAGLKYTGGWVNLTHLTFMHCSITDEGLGFLRNLTKLNHLQLGRCDGYTKAAIQKLRNALPTVQMTAQM